MTDWAPSPPEPGAVETGVLAELAAGVDALLLAALVADDDELELELQPTAASAAAATA